MLAATNQSKDNRAARFIAEQHVRTMLVYHVVRGLIEETQMIEEERAAVRGCAIETRRYGFILEREMEKLGVRLDYCDEDRLRREASRIIQMGHASPADAQVAMEKVVNEVASEILEEGEQSLAAAA